MEVELKYPLPDPAALVRRLTELRATALGAVRQVDTYFDVADRRGADLGLAGASRWLRLRAEGSPPRAFVTFKRWDSRADPDVTRFDEYESAIADYDAVRLIIGALGLAELVTVDKTRHRWRLGEVLVALDVVAGLGSFAEFEYAGDAASVVVAMGTLDATVRDIGVELGKRDRDGYPRLLLRRLLFITYCGCSR